MPNYVSHIVTFNGPEESLNQIEKLYDEKTGVFFNNILPTPEELNIDAGSSEFTTPEIRKLVGFGSGADEQIAQMREAYLKYKNTDTVDNFVQSIRNYIIHGYTSWYRWHIAHWGTKWDACGMNLTRLSNEKIVATFDTAWSTPTEIFEALAVRFPDVVIEADFASEDRGYNCGYILCENGECIISYLEDGTEEALAHATEVLGDWED
jgi:hypothetical protein